MSKAPPGSAFSSPSSSVDPFTEKSLRREIYVGAQTLILGDCLEELMRCPAGIFNTVITSPPYNLGIAYSEYRDDAPRAEFLSWMRRVAEQIRRVLAADGSLFLNLGASNSDPWVGYDVAACFREYLVLQNDIKWVKSISIGIDTHGHFKPLNSRRYLNHNHETIYHFTVTGNVPLDRLAVGVPFKDKSNIERWGHKRDLRCAGNTWFLPYKTVKSRRQKYNHPAGFPLELPLKCLRLTGGKGLKVLDPFMGTGTTLVAAERLGHRGTGIELDARYVKAAVERLAEEPRS